MGPGHGSDELNDPPQLDLAARRWVFRGATDELPRLVVHRVHLLPALCPVPAFPQAVQRGGDAGSVNVPLSAGNGDVRGDRPGSRAGLSGGRRERVRDGRSRSRLAENQHR